MEASTHTKSYHLLGRADVSLQASLKEPSFTRHKLKTPRILVRRARSISSKNKHSRKPGMKVSLAATHLTPALVNFSATNTGSEPRSSRGFKEALQEARAILKTTSPDPKRHEVVTTKPTKSRHVIIQERVYRMLLEKPRRSGPRIRSIIRFPPSQVAFFIHKQQQKVNERNKRYFGSDSEEDETVTRAWKRLERYFIGVDVNNNV